MWVQTMASILFYYSGSINAQAIDGNGNICSDPSTGKFTAAVKFDNFPSTFHPAAVGVSLISLSCSNGSYSSYGIPNILDITNGIYRSRRIVDFSTSTGAPLGQVILDGNFERKNPDLYIAQVSISGTYLGNTNLIIPHGYDLPLTVVNPTKLEGNFSLDIGIQTGGIIQTQHNHIFEFLNGTTQVLNDCTTEVYYDNNSSWDSVNKTLFLPGLSIMRI